MTISVANKDLKSIQIFVPFNHMSCFMTVIIVRWQGLEGIIFVPRDSFLKSSCNCSWSVVSNALNVYFADVICPVASSHCNFIKLAWRKKWNLFVSARKQSGTCVITVLMGFTTFAISTASPVTLLSAMVFSVVRISSLDCALERGVLESNSRSITSAGSIKFTSSRWRL